MLDFGLNAAQILGAVVTGRKTLEVCQTVPSSVEFGCLVLNVTLTALEIAAQTDVEFQICFKPRPARQPVMPKHEQLSPVWPCLMASEAVCWAMELWRLMANVQWLESRRQGSIVLVVTVDQDLDMHPKCVSLYLFKFDLIRRDIIHTFLTAGSHPQFGSTFYYSSFKTKAFPWQLVPLLSVSMASCLQQLLASACSPVSKPVFSLSCEGCVCCWL